MVTSSRDRISSWSRGISAGCPLVQIVTVRVQERRVVATEAALEPVPSTAIREFRAS